MNLQSLSLNPRKTNVGAKRQKLSHNSGFHFELDLDVDLGVSLLEDDDENEENKDVTNLDDGVSPDLNRTIGLKSEPCLHGPTPPSITSSCYPQTPTKSKRRSQEKGDSSSSEQNSYSLKCRPRQKLDKFSRISDEVILEIFHWLPKAALNSCALVCTRWKRLVYDESLWRRLDLGDRNLGPGAMGHVIGRGVNILRLAKTEIATPLGIISSPFNRIAFRNRHCKLQYLDLGMSTINVSGLNELLSVCNKLQCLSLEHCTVDDETCRFIGKNTDLNELNLAMCYGLTTEGLQFILSNCTRLSALNLAWTKLNKQSVAFVVSTISNEIRRLNLSGCTTNLDDKMVENLVTRCPKLKELDLSDSVNLTQKSLNAIVFNLRVITSLSLSRCYNISPESYESLLDANSLVHFFVYGLFNQSGIDFLKTKFPNLVINGSPFSTIARPTTGTRRTSIWGKRVHP